MAKSAARYSTRVAVSSVALVFTSEPDVVMG
jgi:hypothetical protein